MFWVLDVSSSAFHRWKKRPGSQHAQQKQQLAAHICELFEETDGRYGNPRIHRIYRIGESSAARSAWLD